MNNTLLVIGGPTAVGKTACGIEVAKHFGTEIISADSRQFYREPSIGTAVPSPEELDAVPHHFIQFISVTDPYNAAMFESQVLSKLRQLFQRHQVVVMVGGSGLYMEAVCRGIDDIPAADPAIREQLHRRLELEGLASLVRQLAQLDPLSHQRLDLHNPMRVMKALEVSLQTGKPYSSHLTGTPKKRPFRILRAALDMDREALYQRINNRVDRMVEQGLVEEVCRLQEFRKCTAMKMVGYRELFGYIDGSYTLPEAVDRIKNNTRKFARKQITWFRKEDRYRWIGSGPGSEPAFSEPVISYAEGELQSPAKDPNGP